MNFFEVGIPPGIVRAGTELKSAGRWWSSNLIRWTEGVLAPMGGWVQLVGGSPSAVLVVSGKARGIHAWRTNSNVPFLAVGTHTHLYLYTGDNIFDITPTGLLPGIPDTAGSVGYGVGIYGRGLYGVRRQVAGAIQVATSWSLDNFGENLLAVHSDDGRLMEWTGDPAIIASPVVATTGTIPVNNRGVLVTEERFCLLLGADGDPRRIAWSSAEDYTRWAISATTSAGFLTLQSAGIYKSACKVRKQVLIVTNLDAHTFNYVGYPAFYGLDRVATGCGVVGANALTSTEDVAYWMGTGSFFKYDGAVSLLPCTVRDYVFSDINTQQWDKVFAVRVSGKSEIKWFYPSANSVENDRYVTYNTLLDAWAIGTLARTCAEPQGVFPQPIYVSPDGVLYAHEQGFDYGGLVPFIESGPVEMADGHRVYDIVGIWPDELVAGAVSARFRCRYYPNGPVTEHGPYQLAITPASVRFSGREISVRVESSGPHDWRLGRFRFDHVLRGQR